MTSVTSPSVVAGNSAVQRETSATPAPTGGGAVRQAARGAASFDAGQAMLDPGPGGRPIQLKRADGPVQRQGESKKQGGGAPKAGGAVGSFDGLAATVKQIAAGTARGQFASIDVKVDIPTVVPGLYVQIGVQGSIATDDKGMKDFSCQLSGGVKFGLGKILNVSAQINAALNLKGADLGAALVDACKQTLHTYLMNKGVDQILNEAYKALNDPKTRTARLAKWACGEDFIPQFNSAYMGYFSFFKNNGAVGFEVSLGVQAGAAVGMGRVGASGALEAKTGIEDVGNKDAQQFSELSGQVQANLGNNAIGVRFGKRYMANGKEIAFVEANGQIAVPRTAWSPSGKLSFFNALKQGGMAAALLQFYQALAGAKKGAKLGESLALATAIANLGTMAFGTFGDNVSSLMGVEMKVMRSNGKYTVDKARAKLMTQMGTGTNQQIGPVEANIQVGKFFDFAAPINNALIAAGKG